MTQAFWSAKRNFTDSRAFAKEHPFECVKNLSRDQAVKSGDPQLFTWLELFGTGAFMRWVVVDFRAAEHCATSRPAELVGY
jgi:hypothetical protein